MPVLQRLKDCICYLTPAIARWLPTLVLAPSMAFTLWLAWRSLSWPLIGDAAMFHFFAGQILLGATPYRDFIDMNMPAIYVVHAAILALAGAGDLPFRVFDLGVCAVVGALAGALIWPAGRVLGLLAAVAVVSTHLTIGPAAAGQRDFLLLIPLLAAALMSIWIAGGARRRTALLVIVGALGPLAALIKPTGALLVLTPFVVGRFLLKDLLYVLAGAAGTAMVALTILHTAGVLGPFVEMWLTYLPVYAALDRPPLNELINQAANHTVHLSGFALAAIVTLHGTQAIRGRMMIWITIFGLVHFFAQSKGYYYHAYPLMTGVICWGVWGLSHVPRRVAVSALAMIVVLFGLRYKAAIARVQTLSRDTMQSAVTEAMQGALAKRLGPGARVQMLDDGSTAFLAMARMSMRQATPHAYWFMLTAGPAVWRQSFLERLGADSPDGVLITDAMKQYAGWSGLHAGWPEFEARLGCCFDLVEQQDIANSYPHPWSIRLPSWKLYVRRRAAG